MRSIFLALFFSFMSIFAQDTKFAFVTTKGSKDYYVEPSLRKEQDGTVTMFVKIVDHNDDTTTVMRSYVKYIIISNKKVPFHGVQHVRVLDNIGPNRYKLITSQTIDPYNVRWEAMEEGTIIRACFNIASKDWK